MSAPTAKGTAVNRPLSDASVDRLACLLRHWTWAEEAMARFDQELAAGWDDDDDDPMSDHPSGSYYTGAPCCAFGEALLQERTSREIDSLDV